MLTRRKTARLGRYLRRVELSTSTSARSGALDHDAPEPARRQPPDLSGRVALVTGGGRGIGRSLALQLAASGAAVVVVARTEEQIASTVETIREAGGLASAAQVDLSRIADVRRLAATAQEHHGPVDILVNNAAVLGPLGPTMDVDHREVQTAFSVNVYAVMALSSALLPGMLARRWGRIANVSSGVVGRPETMVGGNVYAATKSALEAHTLNLAGELADTGVTVNIYRPGTVDTAMQAFVRAQDPGQVQGGLVERFQRMQREGMLISPAESARGLIERLAGTENGAVWSSSPSQLTSGGPAD